MKTDRFQLLSVGIFVSLGLGLLWIFHDSLGQKVTKHSDGYTLRAVFSDLKQLQPGDEVRMAGVRIGMVQELSLKEGKPTVTAWIDASYPVAKDAVASIDMISLLGGNYLSLTLGTPQQLGVLAPGSVLKTTESSDINQIMGSVGRLGDRIGNLLEGGGGSDGASKGPFTQLGTAIDKLNQLLDNSHAKLDLILDNLQSATAKLDRGEGTLAKLLNQDQAHQSILEAFARFQSAADQFQQLALQAQKMISHVESGQGTLGQLIYDPALVEKLKQSAENFEAFSRKINQKEGTLGRLVNDDELYRELKALLNKAEKTFDAVGDSGPTVAAGVVLQSLF